MRTEVVDLNQLSDSRELLEAREPDFIVLFLSLIMIIIIAAFSWMWFGELDITVRADGILRPRQKVSIIRNINGGEVKEIHYHEGKKVEKGDLLFRLDSPSLELQQRSILEEQENLKAEVERLNRLAKSIQQEKNLFAEAELEFYNRYLIYKYKVEQLKLDLARTEERYLQEKSLPSMATTRTRLKELEGRFLTARLSLAKYKSEFLINIKSERRGKINRLEEIENQLKELKIRESFNTHESPIDGIVQLIQEYNSGDYIPGGIEVLKIIPENSGDYKMEIMVQNRDIGQLKVGQSISYRFLALPSEEYGTLEGRIENISSDAISDQNGGLVYRIEASIGRTLLYDKNGSPAIIKPGMVCEARVVVRKKKILYFVLEKLDFIS